MRRWRMRYRITFMLYTRKGDDGTTKLFDCPQGTRVLKSDFVFEVLGSLDELNSMLGYGKVLARDAHTTLCMNTGRVMYEEIITMFQQVLFCIQAELGGSNVHPTHDHTLFLEEVIYEIEMVLPPVKSFIIPGGGVVGSYLDMCRTVARRVERMLVMLHERGDRNIDTESLQYLNRLSSALYALARFANYQQGYTEPAPSYR